MTEDELTRCTDAAEALPEPAEENDRSRLVTVASNIADAAGPMISAALRPVGDLTSGARRMIGERAGARVRRVRRMGHDPLVNFWDVHPEARRASIREIGLQTVPVHQVAGTAVEGPAQRGGDFLPLKDRRSEDWRSRWQRILNAIENLMSLPPVDLIKFGDTYWVMDGHNRVAAALYNGQAELDALVQEMRLPGMPARPPALIAPVLEDSLALRDAGAGRLTRTADRPTDRLPPQDRFGHGHPARDEDHQRAESGDESPDT